MPTPHTVVNNQLATIVRALMICALKGELTDSVRDNYMSELRNLKSRWEWVLNGQHLSLIVPEGENDRIPRLLHYQLDQIGYRRRSDGLVILLKDRQGNAYFGALCDTLPENPEEAPKPTQWDRLMGDEFLRFFLPLLKCCTKARRLPAPMRVWGGEDVCVPRRGCPGGEGFENPRPVLHPPQNRVNVWKNMANLDPVVGGLKLDAQISHTKVAFDRDTDVHLVVSVSAPVKEGESARPTICIVPVIDVSGSMSGAKLNYAKQSAIKLIEHLKPGDYCGLIAFDSNVRVVVPPQKLTAEAKDKIKSEIGKLHTGGSTNFAGGLLTAVEELDKLDLPEAILQRIVMFTDGQPNCGYVTKPEGIINLLKNKSAMRTTVSAFGYGADVDQQFLLDFAREGKGNYAYIQDPDGALSAFGKELGSLLSTYATNLDVFIEPQAGHDITSVVTDVQSEVEAIGGQTTIKISDILGEETRHLVLAVKLKGQKQAFPRAVNVFSVKLGYDVVDAFGKKERKTLEVNAKVQFVKPGEEDQQIQSALNPIISLAEVVRAQLQAEEAAKKGNFEAAQAVMHKAASRARRRGMVAVAEAADSLSLRLESSDAYQENNAYLRSFQAGATRGMGGAMYQSDALSDLDNLGVVLTNSSQEETSRSFTGADSLPPLVDSTAAPLAAEDFNLSVVQADPVVISTTGSAGVVKRPHSRRRLEQTADTASSIASRWPSQRSKNYPHSP